MAGGPETSPAPISQNYAKSMKFKRASASPQRHADPYGETLNKHGQLRDISPSQGYDTAGALSVENLQTESQLSMMKSFSQLVQEKSGLANPSGGQQSTALAAMNANINKFMSSNEQDFAETSQTGLQYELGIQGMSEVQQRDPSPNERQLSLLR